ADLFGVSLGKGTAKDSEVLRKDKYIPAVDQTVTCNNSISGIELFVESEVFRTMDHELVKLFKRAFIEQEFDSFTRRHLSGFVLFVNSRSTAALFSLKASLMQCLQLRYGLFGLLF